MGFREIGGRNAFCDGCFRKTRADKYPLWVCQPLMRRT